MGAAVQVPEQRGARPELPDDQRGRFEGEHPGEDHERNRICGACQERGHVFRVRDSPRHWRRMRSSLVLVHRVAVVVTTTW